MDFSKFDNQSAAEIAHKITLHQPNKPEGKGEQLFDGKNECRVLCKLPTAPSVRKAERALAKKRMAQKNKKDEYRDMDTIHDEMIESCMNLIVGFENVKKDGRALTDSDEDKEWFLRLVAPLMMVEKDEDGETVKEVAYTRDGQPVTTPKMSMRNDPFAFQIKRKTTELAANLGNGKNG